ncbi:unnamed protein product [Calicophoron daubneyi]|uniref:Ig-like domain-containing protein n=1 Tax=Calicophoron daubneyi TaxID=300641 RepID=A0AAV2T1D1_CALDB
MAFLNVMFFPLSAGSSNEAPPTIVYHLSSYNTDAEAGDPVTLRCAADGIPTPLIYWQRTGGASSIIRNYGATKSGNEIVFDAVTAEDAGEYICFAENSMGRALWRVQLTVRHLPIVRIYPFQPRQKLGCKLRLVCLITANPAVTETGCIWSSNKTGTITSATPGTKIQYLNAGTTRQLVLDRDQIQSTDFWQKFTCTATNTLGTASTSVVLTESATEVLLVNGRHACDSTPQRMTSWATCISMVLLLKLTVL